MTRIRNRIAEEREHAAVEPLQNQRDEHGDGDPEHEDERRAQEHADACEHDADNRDDCEDGCHDACRSQCHDHACQENGA